MKIVRFYPQYQILKFKVLIFTGLFLTLATATVWLNDQNSMSILKNDENKLFSTIEATAHQPATTTMNDRFM